MKLYITRKNKSVDAIMEYHEEENRYTVLKGSKVSDSIAYSSSFRGADAIKKARANGVVIDGIVQKNVDFKSASTAANFVTGTSTNGMVTWKDKSGKTLKELTSKGEN